ncbi:MAG: SRPBCC family protein, partial [Gammaproteobacteria bacterium]
MTTSAVFMYVLLQALSPISSAHGPTRQQVEETITINKPPAQVWALVGDFGGLHKWHPAIKATAMV